MRRMLSKRIKRNSRRRCLQRGLERLEVRNLLAGDVMTDELASPVKEEAAVEEGSVELVAHFGRLEAADWTEEWVEDGESQEGDQRIERVLLTAERLESDSDELLEVLDFEPSMAYRTLTMAGDGEFEEEFIELELGAIPDESLYFLTMASGFSDGEASDTELLDGEEFDDSEVFYTLSFGDGSEIYETSILEMAPGEDEVTLDGEGDEGEIRYFGGVESDDAEVFSTTGAPFMSSWYNESNPLDTNRDGVTTALDALIVFNSLSQLGSVQLSHALFALSSAIDLDANFLVDASNDGYLSPLDALLRVNFLNQETLAQDEVDSTAGQSSPASILPGEWDQYESSDRIMLEESSLIEDAGYDDSTAVFGARIRDTSFDWPDDELGDERYDSETEDEFWSKLAEDESDAILDDELLDILAKV